MQKKIEKQNTTLPEISLPHPIIVALTDDPQVEEQVRAAILAQAGDPILTRVPHDFVEAVDYWFPVLALVDLRTQGDWAAAIRRCKLRPHTRGVPIHAFGDPADPDVLSAAQAAGADVVLTYAQLMEQLNQIIQDHIVPPVVYPEGWDEPLSRKARTGVEEFNRREFYEQHEWLEHAWMDEPRAIREMYQGILQVGVAFYHIEQGNWAGSLKMFRRGLPRLRALPPVCQGIDIARLHAAAEAIHREVTRLGKDKLHEFDHSRFPTIHFVDSSA
jgi:predicted metal-dependent hydrolase/CheY-like chemotaxis protein